MNEILLKDDTLAILTVNWSIMVCIVCILFLMILTGFSEMLNDLNNKNNHSIKMLILKIKFFTKRKERNQIQQQQEMDVKGEVNMIET